MDSDGNTGAVVDHLCEKPQSGESRQSYSLLWKQAISWAQDFLRGDHRKENRRYVPYLITVLLYLAAANTIAPLLGFKPPTKDLNVTAALAIMSMCPDRIFGNPEKRSETLGKNILPSRFRS